MESQKSPTRLAQLQLNNNTNKLYHKYIPNYISADQSHRIIYSTIAYSLHSSVAQCDESLSYIPSPVWVWAEVMVREVTMPSDLWQPP